MEKQPVVVIDGVRYVPLTSVTPPGVGAFREALEALYWGEGKDARDLKARFPETALYISLLDIKPDYDAPTVGEFIEAFAAKIASGTP